MVLSTDFSGRYQGQVKIEDKGYRLEFRLSCNPKNIGSEGNLHEDAVSGDIFELKNSISERIPFSFRSEQVAFKSISGSGVEFSIEADAFGVTESPLFATQTKVKVAGQITPESAWIHIQSMEGEGTELRFEPLEKVDPFFRVLTLKYAIEEEFQQNLIVEAIGNLVKTYENDGIKIDLKDEHTTIENFQDIQAWTAVELNDLLEVTYQTEVTDPDLWPDWKCFGLIVNKFRDLPDAVGVAFDDRDPGNQGFAIFGGHSGLADGNPFATLRRNYVWVHEIGHLFGLGHTKEKTWMMESLQEIHEAEPLQFSSFEKWVLRHNYTLYSIPGYRSGGAYLLGENSDGNLTNATLEITLRSYPVFYVPEPIELEVRIRNISSTEQTIQPYLQPEAGLMVFQIKREGQEQWMEYHPYVRYLLGNQVRVLKPVEVGGEPSGEDRLSQWVTISYGQNGLDIFAPGKYEIRACLKHKDGAIYSAKHPIVVEGDYTVPKAMDKALIQRYLYHNMRQTSTQKHCQTVLKEIYDNHPHERVKTRYAESLARSFGDKRRKFSIKDHSVGIEVDGGAAEEAVRYLLDSKTYYEKNKNNLEVARLENLSYRRHVEWCAHFLEATDKKDDALDLIDLLKKALKEREVKPSALESLSLPQ